MPEVTFLVAVNVDDVTQLDAASSDIESDLTSAGHDVISVHPWARPTVQSTSDAFSAQGLVVPPQPL